MKGVRQRVAEALQVFLANFNSAHVIQMAFIAVERDAVQDGLAALFIAQHFSGVNPLHVRVALLGDLFVLVEIAE